MAPVPAEHPSPPAPAAATGAPVPALGDAGPKKPPGVFGLLGMSLNTAFTSFGVVTSGLAFLALMRSFFDHLKMTASKEAARRKEKKEQQKLAKEEEDALDEEIEVLQNQLNRRKISWKKGY